MKNESLRNYGRQNIIKDDVVGHQGNPQRGYLRLY